MDISNWDWLLPFWKQDSLTNVPLLLVLAIAVAVIAALRLLVSVLHASVRQSLQNDLVQVATSGRRSLLQPSRQISGLEVLEIGRLPVAPRLKRPERRGIWRRARYLMVRPSSPKPAFLVTEFNEIQGTARASTMQGIVVGGSRIAIKVYETESAHHLVYSLRCGSFRCPRNILVCGLSAYLDPSGQAQHYVVDRRHVKREKDAPETAIAFTMDPLYTQRPQGATIDRIEAPEDAFWLVRIDSDTRQEFDRSANVSSETLNLQSEHDDVCQQSEVLSEDGNAKRDPGGWVRALRFLIPAVLIGAGLLFLWAADSVDGNVDGYQLQIGLYVACWTLTWWVAISVANAHLIGYLFLERKRPSNWISSTTRCLRDDAIRRNGFRKSMCRSNRYRMPVRR